ncbi:M14 family metallopeptidase [Flavobacteriaceae bacterium F08102]|nr:M14 family metallopeptidase [Flavobacteriaceae bacterium F08102]
MRNIAIIQLILISCISVHAQEKFTTVFETSNGFETATYEQTIAFYESLANSYPQINIEAIGKTDSGKPLHLVTFSPSGNFDFDTLRINHQILMINNGIHPGESDGIDATMMLYRDLAQGKIATPTHTVLTTIAIYNVGGSLNRNTTTRTNQNGPKEYGFRGNARNYDLNRDFIKSDTYNTQTFAQIYHRVQPDVFVDNHVSNGADYQYILTHLFTQHNKLGYELGTYVHKTFHPTLAKKLAAKNWDITPYVNVFNTVPEKGFSQFMDYPRYSTGYTTLFNTLGLMVETHMLKPYKQRVEGTYELMKSLIELIEEDGIKIREMRNRASELILKQSYYTIDWKVDRSKSSTLNFKGFEGSMVPSKVTGGERLFYDRTKPFTKPITYYNYFKGTDSIKIPSAYIIPQGWHRVIDLLRLNHIAMKRMAKDTVIKVSRYRIINYKSRQTPYEGHFRHSNVDLETSEGHVKFRAGDYYVSTAQKGIRYLLETLEPAAPDSFFNWNFFDTILQQKEGFSPYVWEDKAAALLENHPQIRIAFEAKKASDDQFAKNSYAQLKWLHKASENYESAHMNYPIYRIERSPHIPPNN